MQITATKNRTQIIYHFKAVVVMLFGILTFSSSLFANMTQVKKLISSGNYAAAEKTLYRMYGSAASSSEKANIANWISFSKYKQRDLKGAGDQVQRAFKLNDHNTLDPQLAKDSGYKNFWQDNRSIFKIAALSKHKNSAGKTSQARHPSPDAKTSFSAKTPSRNPERGRNNSTKKASFKSPLPATQKAAAKALKTPAQAKTSRNSYKQKTQPRLSQKSNKLKPSAQHQETPPRKALPKKTILIVNANQPDASITIDGIVVGKSGESLEVDPGIFTVYISKAGYVSVMQRVKIGLGQTLSTAVQLNKIVKPPPPKPLAEKPRAVVSKKDIKPEANPPQKKVAKHPQKNISDSMFEGTTKAKPPKPKPKGEPPPRNAPARSTVADEFAQDVAKANRPVQPIPQQQPYYAAPVTPYATPGTMVPQPYGYAPMPAPGYAAPYPGYGVAPNPYQQPSYGGYIQQPPVQQGYVIPPAAIDSPQLPPTQSAPYVAQPRPEPEMQMNPSSVDALYSENNTKNKRKKPQNRGHNTVPTFIKFMPFGLPQWVGQQYTLGSLFTASQLAAIYLSYDFSSKETIFIDEVNKTIDRRTQEISTLSDETQRQTAQAELDNYVSESKAYRNTLKSNSQMMLGIFGGLWVANVVSAFVYPAQTQPNKRYSEDSLQQPGLQATTNLDGHIKLSYLYPSENTMHISPQVKLSLSINPFHDYNSKGKNRELLLFNVGYTIR